MKSTRALATVSAAVLALSLTACASYPTEGAQRVDETGTSAPVPEATPDDSTTVDEAEGDAEADEFTAAFAERDAFLAAQQQPLDGSALVAKTPEQQALVAEQRAYIESQGAQWDSQVETLTLALTLDACETSILNGHDVTVDVFRAHVATSPLIASVAGDDPAMIDGAVSIMVFGTGFICPDDAPQWEAAWTESGGVY
ncbi:hypothetical protein H9651_09255 [Microbacterium sp. Sa4CUA7]|uniref:Lipoprotein n=1 Tax=Microbacterium pullorum TaxID=2762236 RepID=A0ABR8S2X3_9MICO|nr:hypothetical protein [Microbacterium pullorum]MBD7957822.1 hypothetical protein [Microbacterium pullorum]